MGLLRGMAHVLLTHRMNQKPQSSSAQPPKPQARSENREESVRAGQSGAREDDRPLSSEAKQLASDVADQVAKSAERQLAGGKERAAEAIGHLAEALRETGGQLRTKEMPVVHDYLGRAATQVEGVARYLQKKNLGQVVGDIESFARREPVLFVGSAFVVGLLGGRFLKSSAPAMEERGPGR
jgi:hypothetical protein